MRKIKSNDTKSEVQLRKALWKLGYRYRKNVKTLPGKPDIVFSKKKLVVFIDGEFWHGFNWEAKKATIKANREYWIPKIERNIKRDLLNNEYFFSNGWKVLRFWEKQILKDFENCLHLIVEVLEARQG